MRTAVLALLLLQCVTKEPAKEPAAKPKAPMTESASTGTLTITGTVTKEGVECPAVRGDDGKLYTVVGEGREKLEPGVRVKITGTVAQMSMCMQGTTISADKVEVLKEG